MSLHYENLDEITREFMASEIQYDIDRGQLYIAVNRLSAAGQASYPRLLKEAATAHDDGWLANELRRVGVMNSHQDRHHADGRVTRVRIPVNAPDTLAEGEFNRFYIRALCLRGLDDSRLRLVIYRAKQVENPRPESEAKIGSTIDPAAALLVLRANPAESGWENAIGLAQPNSGLTVRIER